MKIKKKLYVLILMKLVIVYNMKHKIYFKIHHYSVNNVQKVIIVLDLNVIRLKMLMKIVKYMNSIKINVNNVKKDIF